MNDIFECETCSKESGRTVNVRRFITALDKCFLTDDLAGADKLIDRWKEEAIALGDERGLLTVMNEGLGFYRRTSDEKKALDCIELVKSLIVSTGADKTVSGATVYVNLATTLKAFGRAKEGFPFYALAERIYLDHGMGESFEYSALLNNRASAYGDLEEDDEAESSLLQAVEVLKKLGGHDGEVAVSLINLAHIVYDRSELDTARVEKLLDEAWEYLNSPDQPRDANYAFILSKCAPSLRYFNRVDEAEALEEVAKFIYGQKK